MGINIFITNNPHFPGFYLSFPSSQCPLQSWTFATLPQKSRSILGIIDSESPSIRPNIIPESRICMYATMNLIFNQILYPSNPLWLQYSTYRFCTDGCNCNSLYSSILLPEYHWNWMIFSLTGRDGWLASWELKNLIFQPISEYTTLSSTRLLWQQYCPV